MFDYDLEPDDEPIDFNNLPDNVKSEFVSFLNGDGKEGIELLPESYEFVKCPAKEKDQLPRFQYVACMREEYSNDHECCLIVYDDYNSRERRFDDINRWRHPQY
jgi:hypothetical protein